MQVGKSLHQGKSEAGPRRMSRLVETVEPLCNPLIFLWWNARSIVGYAKPDAIQAGAGFEPDCCALTRVPDRILDKVGAKLGEKVLIAMYERVGIHV